jgi:2-polyprenyl-6-methoxyphenol hydroxylase-like FAD-dependent oxidoreductase
MPRVEISSHSDVLIVGAGPVGLLLASEISLAGLTVQVIERTTEASRTIKAGSINLASAEILARRGLLDEAKAAHQRGVSEIAKLIGGALSLDSEEARATASRKVVRAGHFAAIPLDNEIINNANPDIAEHQEALEATFIPQRDIESLLGDYATSLGVAVRRGIDVTGIEQAQDAVTVQSGTGTFHASYVVGCDGGRSVVRKAIGFDFPGSDPEITGRQAVVELDDVTLLQNGWNWSTRGVYRYGPTPGVVLTVEFDGPPTDRTSEVTASEIEASLRRTSGTEVRVMRLIGQGTRWTDNARQAAAYRNGRVFLAGDAAHVHSPFSGQGLNLGLGDATNLGWKLAATIAGWAPKDLLETYNSERHPIGKWVLDWTRAQVALMRPNAKVGQLRSVVAELMHTRDGMTEMVNKISGVLQRADIAGDHPLLGRLIPDIALEDGRSARAAFVAGRFVLLDRTNRSTFIAAADAWQDRAELIPGKFTSTDPNLAALLVRPDGVIIWTAMADAATDVDDLSAALRKWAGNAA